MPSVAILIPVLNRPHLIVPLLESLAASTVAETADGWKIRPVFACTLGDAGEYALLDSLGYAPLVALAGPGEYARKINEAANFCDDPWLFTGADDLCFHPGWLRACITRHVKTGALVVGTNDLHNPTVTRGLYATHSLVHRDYLERGTIDEPGKILHEGYDHNCCDTELVETAKSRGTFAFARDAHVEHLHHLWRGAPDDATYRKGRQRHREDKLLLSRRRVLWSRTASERRRLRSVDRVR